MDSLKKLSETMDSNLNLIRQRVEQILDGLVSKENQLNAVQESVMQRTKEVDAIGKSVEERRKEVEKKEEELKEQQLIREGGLKDLELKTREIGVREEKLNEQEKSIQELFERMESERRNFEDIKKSIDGRFTEISQKERILDEKLERQTQENELKEKIFNSREAELLAKEKELEGRERVLASRNDQIVLREKQLELRKIILDLKTREKDGSMVLADVVKEDFVGPNTSALLGKSHQDLRRKEERMIQLTEVPPEGSLPKRNTGNDQVERTLIKEKEHEAQDEEEEELGHEEKEFESAKEKEKNLSWFRDEEEEEEGELKEGFPPRSNLIIPKEEDVDGRVGLAACAKGNSREANVPAQNGESGNLTQKSRKRGRNPTNQVELNTLYMKTEPRDGNEDSTDGVIKGETGPIDGNEDSSDGVIRGNPRLPDADVSQLGETPGTRINSNKRGRIQKNQVTISGNGPSTQIQKDPVVSKIHIFENDKQEFLPGQTWACYDGSDGMPRRYVRIWQKSIHGLRGGILVPDSTTKKRDFPVGCGKFVCEGSRIILNASKFSHQMFSEFCSSGGYWIYPRKGEIWAIFEDWDTASSSNSVSQRQYKYEIVEVLSDFVMGAGIRVSYLEKIKGYVNLFQQRTGRSTASLIFPNRLFRFSHRICAFQMNGTESEREGVPKGSFALDPAALPSSLCR